MTKSRWCEHIELMSGLARPSKGGAVEPWRTAILVHKNEEPDCELCAARRATKKATAGQKVREQAYRDAGLVKGRTGLGRVIWE